MSVDVTALVGGAVGGAAIQSVLGPLFGQMHDRRGLRARTLEGVAAVENARWAHGKEDHEEFRRALTQLRSAALIAGVSRSLLDAYILAAAAGFGESQWSWERFGEEPEGGGGGISGPLANYVRACGQALTAYAWHPWWGRFRLRLTLRRLNASKQKLTTKQEDSLRAINWDNVWVPN